MSPTINSPNPIKRKTGGGAIRPLSLAYADVLERQAMRRNVAYPVQYFDVRGAGLPELPSESPPNVAFLLQRELAKLRAFEQLLPNWDSYGAPAIQAAAVQSATELVQDPLFVKLLPYHHPRLAAFPLRNGGIQLDLNGGKAPLEIEISPDGEREFTLFGPDDEVIWEKPTLAMAIELYHDFSPVLLGVA
ncbi:hypothetical protein [Hymenobacter sp.]|uniref:hypothetical protein n=1 Tax=Hymenobacter sp. TaxID=1898978 RepID=UPI00286A4257|nr:hypothetical protein [Hymenobacter sp.]